MNTENNQNKALNKTDVSSSILLKSRLEFILECPKCKNELCTNKEIEKFASNIIEEIGYDSELASKEDGLEIHCAECDYDFTILGVSHF